MLLRRGAERGWRRAVKYRGRRVERPLTEYEDGARWLKIVVGGLPVLRFMLGHLGMWPWRRGSVPKGGGDV